MPAEAATDVADISHRLDMAADGFVADTQCHAEFFGADFIVFFDEWHCTGFLAIRHDSMPNGYNCMVFTYGFAGIAKSTENSAQICNRLCSSNCLYSLHCCVDLF